MFKKLGCWIGKQLTFTKIMVAYLVFKGVGWIDQSYQLAWAGKEEIASDLSEKVVVEILGVALLYCVKALFNSLSEHNQWPDKPSATTCESTEKKEDTPI
jgi:hypothetical protein